MPGGRARRRLLFARLLTRKVCGWQCGWRGLEALTSCAALYALGGRGIWLHWASPAAYDGVGIVSRQGGAPNSWRPIARRRHPPRFDSPPDLRVAGPTARIKRDPRVPDDDVLIAAVQQGDRAALRPSSAAIKRPSTVICGPGYWSRPTPKTCARKFFSAATRPRPGSIVRTSCGRGCSALPGICCASGCGG